LAWLLNEKEEVEKGEKSLGNNEEKCYSELVGDWSRKNSLIGGLHQLKTKVYRDRTAEKVEGKTPISRQRDTLTTLRDFLANAQRVTAYATLLRTAEKKSDLGNRAESHTVVVKKLGSAMRELKARMMLVLRGRRTNLV